MILADTSIWIDHLRFSDTLLRELLEKGSVLIHPFVIGEIALGSIHQRESVLGNLKELPETVVADDGEVLALVARHRMYGMGIGYIDAHLLAATLLTPGASLLTRDKRLGAIAQSLGISATNDN